MSSAFERLAPLLRYPREDYLERADLALEAVRGIDPAERSLQQFIAAVGPMPLADLEESFTVSFDLDPVAALEVGWHLYGDTYERGRFLVEMRERLQRLGIPADGELPDHLALVLRMLPLLEPADAEGLARGAVAPAIAKMIEPLRSRGSVFLPLLVATSALVDSLSPAAAGAAAEEVPA